MSQDDVCSPAGPAMIGVKTLEDRGFRSSVINAVVDAYKRCAIIHGDEFSCLE